MHVVYVRFVIHIVYSSIQIYIIMHYNLLSCLKAFAAYFIRIYLFFELGETPNDLEGSQKKKTLQFSSLFPYTIKISTT